MPPSPALPASRNCFLPCIADCAAWKKGLENLALLGAKKKAEKTLKFEIDEEAFARLYGHQSHPFPVKKGQQIAVRVISQFGEETTKILVVA